MFLRQPDHVIWVQPTPTRCCVLGKDLPWLYLLSGFEQAAKFSGNVAKRQSERLDYGQLLNG